MVVSKLSIFFVLFFNLAFSGKLYFQARNEVKCEDGITKCSLDQTCCRNSRNDFGCCGFANATCCDNGLNCCPSGFHCSRDGCLKNKKVIQQAESSINVLKSAEEVVCPDKVTFCQKDQTCCLLSGNKYGCCPLPDAVCCSDHEHCCPAGSTCDAAHSACRRQDGLLIGWKEKLPANQLGDTMCPDKQSYCPSKTTCCLMSQGGYGCCPIPNAVCCEDHQHCCPTGYTCDVEKSSCEKLSSSSSFSSSSSSSSLSVIPLFKKVPSYKFEDEAALKKHVLCPNKTIFCDEGYTCCPIKWGGQEACCMFYHGVCCEDMVTCCPSGSVCSQLDGVPRCFSAEERQSAIESVAMLERAKTQIVPCDSTVFCQDGQTCCKHQASFMCCPYKGASCCSNGQTCCKSWCMPLFNKCLPSTDAMSPFQGAVEAPAANAEAQKANWCDTGKSLYCPEGYQCDVGKGRCFKDTLRKSAPPLMMPQLEASRLPNVCPSPSPAQPHTLCGPSEMCCADNEGGLNKCCPYAEGVCCEGGGTCCPSSSSCTGDGRCRALSSDIFIDQDKLTPPPAVNHLSPEVGSVCPDTSVCPEDTTCCILLDNQYACCQFKMAVCCEDKLHCCPQGYTCDVERSRCLEGTSSTSWLMFTRSRALKAVKAAPASSLCTPSPSLPPTHRCPVDHSCCHDQNDVTNPPVCCDRDSKCCSGFCCPKGYKCGVVERQCLKAVSRAPLVR